MCIVRLASSFAFRYGSWSRACMRISSTPRAARLSENEHVLRSTGWLCRPRGVWCSSLSGGATSDLITRRMRLGRNDRSSARLAIARRLDQSCPSCSSIASTSIIIHMIYRKFPLWTSNWKCSAWLPFKDGLWFRSQCAHWRISSFCCKVVSEARKTN